jgi:hypothetical protein
MLRACSRSWRVAFALSVPFALAACAGGIDTKPDRPFRTANVCLGSAIPDGWIRTNDWRGKGCGVDESTAPAKAAPGAKKAAAGIQLASTAAMPNVKAKPTIDLSRGANAVAESGPNNWVTITELDRVRIGRFLTACAGDVPAGWTETARYWDKGRCGNPTKSSIKNVMLIERVK